MLAASVNNRRNEIFMSQKCPLKLKKELQLNRLLKFTQFINIDHVCYFYTKDLLADLADDEIEPLVEFQNSGNCINFKSKISIGNQILNVDRCKAYRKTVLLHDSMLRNNTFN